MRGPHLMLDCYQCDARVVRDLRAVYDLLAELPGHLGVHAITKPFVFLHRDSPREEPGITGFVVVAESHVSIHTFPARKNYVTLDAYSCRDFNAAAAKKFILGRLKPKIVEEYFIERGQRNKALPARRAKR